MSLDTPSSTSSIEGKFARLPELFEEFDPKGEFIPRTEYPGNFLNDFPEVQEAVALIAKIDPQDPTLKEFETKFDAVHSAINTFLPLKQEVLTTREIRTGINGARIIEIQKAIRRAAEDVAIADLKQELTKVQVRVDLLDRYHKAKMTLRDALDEFEKVMGNIRLFAHQLTH